MRLHVIHTELRSCGNPVPITGKFVQTTASKFSERQIHPFRAFHGPATLELMNTHPSFHVQKQYYADKSCCRIRR